MKNEKRGLIKSRASEIQIKSQNFGSTKPSDFQEIKASDSLKRTLLWKSKVEKSLTIKISMIVALSERSTKNELY
jgi:hypothetical protein